VHNDIAQITVMKARTRMQSPSLAIGDSHGGSLHPNPFPEQRKVSPAEGRSVHGGRTQGEYDAPVMIRRRVPRRISAKRCDYAANYDDCRPFAVSPSSSRLCLSTCRKLKLAPAQC
jgi:hypothetical protein